jgi:hypothetical protein
MPKALSRWGAANVSLAYLCRQPSADAREGQGPQPRNLRPGILRRLQLQGKGAGQARRRSRAMQAHGRSAAGNDRALSGAIRAAKADGSAAWTLCVSVPGVSSAPQHSCADPSWIRALPFRLFSALATSRLEFANDGTRARSVVMGRLGLTLSAIWNLCFSPPTRVGKLRVTIWRPLSFQLI